MNKILKRVGIILSVILVLLIIYCIVIHFHGFLDKSDAMTREEVISLLEKGKEYPNYYYSPKDVGISGWIEETIIPKLNKNVLTESTTERYIKDNIVKTLIDGYVVKWENFNTDEQVIIAQENNERKLAFITDLSNYDKELPTDNQIGFDYSLITMEDVFNFEYMGKRNLNNRETIVVKVWNKNDLKLDSIIFYIDKDTGLLMRRIDYAALGLIKFDCDRNVKLDCVSDEDVQKPNLDGYTIVENER